MLESIAASVRDSAAYTGRSELSERVMRRMGEVPRHAYVPDNLRSRAYLNTALPIAHEQTISQPMIVALMTDFLDPQAEDVVLEVGTGSGYQAAILAGLVDRVYSIEIIPELARSAAHTLQQQGIANVSVRAGDGYSGWPELAPFDGIIVTAAAPHIPQALIDQLKPDAKLVIPVDHPGGGQNLILVEKSRTGKLTQRSVLPVRFVPLTGEH